MFKARKASSFPSSVGISPVISLFPMFKARKDLRFPSSVGISPLISLFATKKGN